MKIILKNYSFALAVISSPCVFSAEQPLNQWYVEGMVGGALSKNSQELSGYGRTGGGVILHDNLLFGAGISGLTDRDTTKYSIKPEVYLRPRISLNENTYIYSDLIYRNQGDKLAVGLGLQYVLSNNWALDAGYRWHKVPINEIQGDIYTFGFGIQYLFGKKSTNAFISGTNSEEPVIKHYTLGESDVKIESIKPQVFDYCRAAVTSVNDVNAEQCNLFTSFRSFAHCKSVLSVNDAKIMLTNPKQLKKYYIKPSAWLNRISREHCISLEALIVLNPNLLSSKYKDLDLVEPYDQITLPSSRVERLKP